MQTKDQYGVANNEDPDLLVKEVVNLCLVNGNSVLLSNIVKFPANKYRE